MTNFHTPFLSEITLSRIIQIINELSITYFAPFFDAFLSLSIMAFPMPVSGILSA